MKLKLIRPCSEYQAQIVHMLDHWLKVEDAEDITPCAIVRRDYHDFERYCSNLDIQSAQNGFVPDVTYFCYDEDRDLCVGAVNIRLMLNDRLLRAGGHVGDGICPAERGKGYGTKMVALALEECAKRGISPVLMVCDKENAASRKTILRNGGVLENEIEAGGCILQRYWIDVK